MLNPGDLIANKLRIVRRLGAGGMGVVYEAVQVHLGRRVAVKVIRADESESAEARARFMRDARAQALLPLEHIVQVLDVDSLPDGSLYTVMELLDGRDLKRELRKRGPLPVAEAVSYVIQACAGAGAAHAAGIVHRDLKPQNLFVVNLGGVRKIKILDFGIAKFMTGMRQDLTATDEVVGTPTHLSPEQIAGDKVDGRADIWALGIVLFELLTDHTPFRRATALATLGAIANDAPTMLSMYRPDVPDALESVIEKCFAKSPGERYQTTAELAAALAPFAEGFTGTVSVGASRGSSMPAAPISEDLAMLPDIVPVPTPATERIVASSISSMGPTVSYPTPGQPTGPDTGVAADIEPSARATPVAPAKVRSLAIGLLAAVAAAVGVMLPLSRSASSSSGAGTVASSAAAGPSRERDAESPVSASSSAPIAAVSAAQSVASPVTSVPPPRLESATGARRPAPRRTGAAVTSSKPPASPPPASPATKPLAGDAVPIHL